MSNINSYVWRDARLTHDKNEQQVEEEQRPETNQKISWYQSESD